MPDCIENIIMWIWEFLKQYEMRQYYDHFILMFVIHIIHICLQVKKHSDLNIGNLVKLLS